MAKKFGNKKIKRYANTDYAWMHETFEQTIMRWAGMAANQLHDAYKMQKVYDGSGSSTNEVWHRGNYGWNDENESRRRLAAKNPSADYWFSTGESFRRSNVTAENIRTHKEANADFLIQGQVTFHTTMNMLYVEAGVGATGREKGKPRTSKPLVRPYDYAVFRSDPWTTKHRYVDKWAPTKGKTVRPNTRQQAFLMKRRLAWLAKNKFDMQIFPSLIAGFEALDDVKVENIAGVLSFTTEVK